MSTVTRRDNRVTREALRGRAQVADKADKVAIPQVRVGVGSLISAARSILGIVICQSRPLRRCRVQRRHGWGVVRATELSAKLALEAGTVGAY